jgi:hypothetical protein
MLGYKPEMTSKERHFHFKKLMQKFGDGLKSELMFANSWLNDPNFLHAIHSNDKSQLLYCKRSMEHPPLKLLDKLIEKATKKNLNFKFEPFEIEKECYPKCYCCDKKLAHSILDITDFAMIKCECGVKYTHIICAEKKIESDSQCSLCKQYYILNNIKQTTLQSTLLKF